MSDKPKVPVAPRKVDVPKPPPPKPDPALVTYIEQDAKKDTKQSPAG